MNPALRSMLERYKCVTLQDYENALKEIIQEIALLGLWRSKFFEHAAFYGGTALRILYGLDRFSEDLDFSLLEPQKSFKLSSYIAAVESELSSMGFSVDVEERTKTAATSIESAFIKAGTKEHLLKIEAPNRIAGYIPNNKILKVKFEVDVDPPAGFVTEAKTILQPIPFSINTFTPPDLFAGKLHAVLHRQWKLRVKGRDYYDFVWYISRGIPVRLSHLEQRLRQSGEWTEKRAMKPSNLRSLLEKRFAELDVKSAKSDIAPFVRDPAALDLWSTDFFLSLIPQMKVE